MASRHADGASLASDIVVFLPEESSTDRGWAYSSALSTVFSAYVPGILDSRVVAGMSPSRQMWREHKMGQLSRRMSRLGAEMRRRSHCECCALVLRPISSGDWWAKTSTVGESRMIWQKSARSECSRSVARLNAMLQDSGINVRFAWAGTTRFCMLSMGSPLADRVDAGQRCWSAMQYTVCEQRRTQLPGG